MKKNKLQQEFRKKSKQKANFRHSISDKINKSIVRILVPALLVLIIVSCIMAANTVSTSNRSVMEAQANTPLRG